MSCTPSSPSVKFLGSYPAEGTDGAEVRLKSDAAWRDAESWMERLRAQIRPNGIMSTERLAMPILKLPSRLGGMAERTNARVLKTLG